MFCGMAAFKAHCAFGFWNDALRIEEKKSDAMGSFGRITTLADLPKDDVLVGYVQQAARLKDAGVPRKARPKEPKKPLPVPADLKAALGKSAKARATFEGFSPSHRREYVEWIIEAKGEETRARRLATAIEWMAEGKSRMWKYERKKPTAKKR
jgi:uncharacterized protein YdeI (YjbR/CyaY-like superfamily)